MERTTDFAFRQRVSDWRGERDLRTRAGRRNEILKRIEDHGGFSIFWVTDNHLRACVAQEMQDSGEIVTDTESCAFPWIAARISKQNND